jgi:methylthioribose-1-phosphate isomerase
LPPPGAWCWPRAGAGRRWRALQQLEPALQRLNAARPTAVNLAWALARMRRCLNAAGADWRARWKRGAGHRRGRPGRQPPHGRAGRGLIEAGSGVLTHCNTGSLATAASAPRWA